MATNHHVIDGATAIFVMSRFNAAGSRLPATVQWSSRELDLAILRVDGLNLPSLTLALGEPTKGQDVWALGFPGDADRPDAPQLDASLKEGALSRIVASSWSRGGRQIIILQHTASTNPGMSGGPLLDECGNVVGINTQASLAEVITLSGRPERVTQGAGIYWSSHAKELAREMDRLSISHTNEPEPCANASGSGGAENFTILQDLVDDYNRQLLTQNAKLRSQTEKLDGLTQQYLFWGILLAFSSISALVIAMRKPRERIVKIVESVSKPVRGAIRRLRQDSGESAATQFIVTGFDGRGHPIRETIPFEWIASEPGGISLGRHHELVDIILDHDGISNRHARIRNIGSDFLLEDLNSSKGTILQGTKLEPYQPVPLILGSEIQLGELALKVSQQ